MFTVLAKDLGSYTMANLQVLVRTTAHVTLALLVSGLISAAPVQERQDTLQSHDPQSETNHSNLTSTTDGNATARVVRNACDLPDNVAALRRVGQNYLSPLFAYSELLEQIYPPICSGSRKKRSDGDDRCPTIEADLSEVDPDNSGVLCPYVYQCDYDPSRYPRYIITAKCSTTYPTNDTDESGVHRCKPFGTVILKVLRHNGESWNTNSLADEEIYHGCELRDISKQS